MNSTRDNIRTTISSHLARRLTGQAWSPLWVDYFVPVAGAVDAARLAVRREAEDA